MEFETLVKNRASIRRFSDKKPPIELMIKLIEIANLAPSPGNLPILKYLIIEDLDKIEKISEACQQEFIKQAQILIVICSESKKTDIMYDKRSKKYMRQHAGAAIENLLLAITNSGLSSCWVGAYSDMIIKTVLNIPEEVEIEAILPIGYKHIMDKTGQRAKPDLMNRIFFEKWKNKYRKPFRRAGD